MKKLFFCFSMLLVFLNAKAQTVTAHQGEVLSDNHLKSMPIKLHAPKEGILSLVWRPLAERTDDYDPVDSIWYPIDSSSYFYDANGNDTAAYEYEEPYSTTNDWQNAALNYYRYDASGHQVISGNQNWLNYRNEWRYGTQTVSTYDAAGDNTVQLDQSWDTVTSGWDSYANFLFQYDADHHNTVSITQEWISGGWQNVYQSTYTYDSDNETEELDQSWDATASQWDDYGRYTYIYSSNNDTVIETHSLWDDTTSQWKTQWRNINFYLPNFSVTLSEGWDPATVSFDSEWEETVIDSSGYLKSDEYAIWKAGILTPQNQEVYSYDNKGNNVQEKLYSGDSSSDGIFNGWTAEEGVFQTFDANNNITEYLDGGFGYEGTGPVTYYFAPRERDEYSYGSFNAGVGTEPKNELGASIFPNPILSEDATIQLQYDATSTISITIFDEQGSVVTSITRTMIPDNNNIDVPIRNIAAGNYFVRVVDQQSGKTSVLKMTKE